MAISVEDFYRKLERRSLAADLRHRLRALLREARAKSLIRRAHHRNGCRGVSQPNWLQPSVLTAYDGRCAISRLPEPRLAG